MKYLDICAAQERTIKDEENRWVQFVIWFYGGLVTAVTFLVKDFGSANAMRQQAAATIPSHFVDIVLWGSVILALLAHYVFASTFAKLRLTYYRIRPRLEETSTALLVRSSDKLMVDEVESYAEWASMTRPWDTYIGRLLLLLLGHLPLWHLLAVGLRLEGAQEVVFIIVGYAFVAGVTLWFVAVDFKTITRQSGNAMRLLWTGWLASRSASKLSGGR